MYRKVLGMFKLFVHLLSINCRSTIREIVNTLVNSQIAAKQKIFVMMVGYSKAGKTSYVRKDARLKKFFNLSTNNIHDLLNSNFAFLRDDDTVYGEAYWERQYLTRIVRKKVLEKAFSKGLAVVSDSANLVRKERLAWVRIAKKYSYETTIVWVTCPEEELLTRLQKADKELVLDGKNPTWIDLYRNVQRERFDPPMDYEADNVKTAVC